MSPAAVLEVPAFALLGPDAGFLRPDPRVAGMLVELVGSAAGTWERLGRIDVGNRGVTAWRSVRDVLDEARGTS